MSRCDFQRTGTVWRCSRCGFVSTGGTREPIRTCRAVEATAGPLVEQIPVAACPHRGGHVATLDRAACGCTAADRRVYTCDHPDGIGSCLLHAAQRPGPTSASTASGLSVRFDVRIPVCAVCRGRPKDR